MTSHDAQSKKLLPPLVVTVGDPCGIGPEIVHRALKRTTVLRHRDVLVIGNVLPFSASIGDGREMQGYNIAPFDDFLMDPDGVSKEFERAVDGRRRPIFLDLGDDGRALRPGDGSPLSGSVAIATFEAALEVINEFVGSGELDGVALCTAPVSKYWINDAGYAFTGHTGTLGEYFEVPPVMTFVGGGLRVALVTTHLPLADVPAAVSASRLKLTVRTFHHALQQDFSIPKPRIAVCGLNPHAGERGLLGTEEQDVMEPALNDLRKEGCNLTGPIAADTAFVRAHRGEFDGVVAMYHDQGLGPIKLLAFDTGVNVTLNLPIVRTSPDHGTAFEIAGKGLADSTPMLAAIEFADAASRRRLGDDPGPTLAEEHLDPLVGRRTAKLRLPPRPDAQDSGGIVL